MNITVEENPVYTFSSLGLNSFEPDDVISRVKNLTDRGLHVEVTFEKRPPPTKFRELLLKMRESLPATQWFLSREDSIIAGVLFNLNFSRPRRAVVEIANGCNLKCDFCWTHSPLLETKPDAKWLKQILPSEKIYRYIDELAQYRSVWLLEFCAIGDPLYHPDIWEMIEYTKARNLGVRLSTNGTLLYPDKWDKHCAVPVNELFMNISAGDRDTYADIHNVSPKVFDQLIINLKHINAVRKEKKQDLFMRWINIITDKNISNISKIVDAALDAGADYLDFRYVWIHKEFQKNIGVSATSLNEQKSQLLEARDKLRASGVDSNLQEFLNSMNIPELTHV